MLKPLKTALLGGLESLGGGRLVLNSGWRTRRLLILCYHGLSLDDEHVWDPQLYMRPGFFRRRLEILRSLGSNVLPLNEALERLRSATLPERSVVLTFDDGTFDFIDKALPLLKQFGFPATVYSSTYYCLFQRPVFNVMLSYLLWKGRHSRLVCPELAAGRPLPLDAAGRLSTWNALQSYTLREGLSGAEKDALLASIAARLNIDYQALCRRRVLHLLTPEEVGRVHAAGIDVQLHTHRHRTPRESAQYLREIEDNRAAIEAMAPVSRASLCHFCYPSGDHFPEALPWLADAGIRSAVTCEPGLASRDCPPLLLPRVADHEGLSEIEFTSWISGLASWLPRRPPEVSTPGAQVVRG